MTMSSVQAVTLHRVLVLLLAAAFPHLIFPFGISGPTARGTGAARPARRGRRNSFFENIKNVYVPRPCSVKSDRNLLLYRHDSLTVTRQT